MKLAMEFDIPAAKNWVGYEGPTEKALETAKTMRLMPVMDGGLMLEMQAGGIRIEVMISPAGELCSASRRREP